MRRHQAIVATIFLCLSLADHASAQVYDWTNAAGGTFGTAANWSAGGPPNSSGETGRFALSSTYNVNFSGGESFGTLTQSAGNVTFLLNGWTLQPTNTTNNGIGSATGASLRITNGNFRPGGYSIGTNPGTSGTLLLDTGLSTTVGSGAFQVGTSGTGTLTVQAGATLATPNNTSIATNAGAIGTATVIGGGSTWTANTTLRVGAAGNGTLNVRNGGVVTASALEVGESFNSVGTLSVSGASAVFTTGGLANIGGTSAALPAASATVNVGPGGTINLNGTTNLRTAATVNVTGGTLNLSTLNMLPGADVNWSAGTVRFANATAITPAVLDLFLDGTNTLGTNRTLAATAGLLNLTTNLDLNGGKISVSSLQLNADLTVGAFSSVTAAASLSIESGRTLQVDDFGSIGATTSLANNGGVLQLNGPLATVSTLMTNNSGVVQGTGRFASGLNNGAGGTIRAAVDDHLIIQTAGLTNPGSIELVGGTVEYTHTLSNLATGIISGRGIFRGSSATPGGSGLSNLGVVAFSAGTTDIYGDVVNSGAGTIVAAGGSVVTFFDDVTHNGNEIRTNTGSRTVFFGALTGAGPFTGGGTVESNGDLRPGNSAAEVTFGGDLELGIAAGLDIELGGTAKGVEHDALTVAGSVVVGGALNVSLINGFAPQAGDTFEIITANNGVDGSFDDELLPALGGGLYFDVLYQPTAVMLAVAGTPGDYNYDGMVDAADYIVWRKTSAQSGSGLPADGNNNGSIDPTDYTVWTTNFGQPAPGAGNSNSRVPEPATIVLLAIALLQSCNPRTRSEPLAA